MLTLMIETITAIHLFIDSFTDSFTDSFISIFSSAKLFPLTEFPLCRAGNRFLPFRPGRVVRLHRPWRQQDLRHPWPLIGNFAECKSPPTELTAADATPSALRRDHAHSANRHDAPPTWTHTNGYVE